MPLTVDATYENGVLRPAQPLPLNEHQKVRVTVQPLDGPTPAVSDEAEAFVRRSYGLLRWTGDRETLRHLAEDPEFDPQESA
jgi:predicted DNA-binding antitoxin AbrB/MazE fold protein